MISVYLGQKYATTGNRKGRKSKRKKAKRGKIKWNGKEKGDNAKSGKINEKWALSE